MSKDTWLKIERGETGRAGSYAKVESALHWAPGSCQDILDGGKPVPDEPLDDSHVVAVVPVEEREGVARQAVES
ncbi:hypothetical protein KBZ21_37495, partial [Streptomyces sp. A73]|nr:hypothetical protein [Streptomyces sp. A73]